MTSPPQDILVHLHIPKNAGTTLSRMLKIHLLLHPPTRLLHHEAVLGYYFTEGHAEDRLRRIEAASERNKRRIRFFEAHCGFGVHRRLPGPCTYLTTVRDPIDRALSVFYFRKQQGTIPQDLSMDSWLSEHPANPVWHVDNGQVRYLASDDGRVIDCPVGEVSRDMLDRAKSRLEHDIAFVGLVDRFDESVVLLRRTLGWRSLSYATSNITAKRKAKAELSQRDRDVLCERNTLDTELFAFARELFQQRINESGPGFEDDLARFRERNRRHANRFGRFYDHLPRARRFAQRLLRR